MIVKKKGESSSSEHGSSSMIMGETSKREGHHNKEGSAEEELYRLMRGRGYETEEEEDEDDDGPGEEDEDSESGIAPADPPIVLESAAPEWGSSSSAPEWGSGSVTSSSVMSAVSSEVGSGWLPTYKHSELMGWGNSALQNAEKEISFETGNQEWRKKSEDYLRSKRNEEMEGGKSPPPKLREDNLFTDGDSRPSSKTTYQTKEEKNNWGFGNDEKEEPEETLSSLFDEVNAGTFVAKKKVPK